MANDFDLMKELNIDPAELKGKSQFEIMDLIQQASSKRKMELASTKDKELLENATTKLPKIKEQFENPFKVFATKVGQSDKAGEVSVIGYNPFNPDGKNYLVTKLDGKKVFQVSESNIIKTETELEEAR
jgi:RNA recognition motif-containing protein